MTLRSLRMSPWVAILWETWRVTRVEAAWKFALPIGIGLVALFLTTTFAPDNSKGSEVFTKVGAGIALYALIFPSFIGWISLAKLNGGRPGFPFCLLYSRPARTAVIVGIPMVYLAIASAATYLVSALLFKVISGHPFPLLSVAALVAVLNLVLRAATWSSRSMLVLTLGSLAAFVFSMRFIRLRTSSITDGVDWNIAPQLWPAIFDFQLVEYALFALIGLVSFGITVAMVTRQRRGDEQAPITSTLVGGLRGWFINLFNLPCPTSSATRAQLWFDLKSNGVPVLSTGAALAILILVLSAVGGYIDAAYADDIRARLSCKNADCFYVRAWPVIVTPMALLLVLFLARNAFGIRSKQGRTDMSVFEAAQPFRAAQLASLKVLLKSGCVLAALIVLGVSLWMSISLLGDPVFVQMFGVPLSSRLPAIENAVAALAGYEQLAIVILATVGIVTWVAALAVFGALRTRHSRHVNIAAWSLLFSLIGLAVLKQAEHQGFFSPFVVDTIFTTTRWIFFAIAVFAIVCVFWIGVIGFAERLLNVRYVSGAAAISLAFGAAWLAVLHMGGVRLAEISAMNAFWILTPALLPPILSVLAPWSLSRVRHI